MKYITKHIKNNKFNTTLIDFIFQFKCSNEELMSIPLLCKLLLTTNYSFKVDSEFNKEKLRRYIIGCDYKEIYENDVCFIVFSLVIPNQNIIKEDFLNKALQFFLDCIYKPNLENGYFNKILFEREKKSYTQLLLNNYKNLDFIAEKSFLDLIDPSGIFNKIKYRDLDNIKMLQNEDLIEFYNKYIYTIKPKIFIIGDNDFDKIENIFMNYMNKLNLKDYKLETSYDNYFTDLEYKTKEENSNYFQSIIYVSYIVKDYKDKDKYIGLLIDLLLSNPASDLILTKLRKNNNLVYTAGSSFLARNGILLIKAQTSKRNLKLTKLVILDLINSLKTIENYEENINNVLNKMRLNIERQKDNFFKPLKDIENEYFKLNIKFEKEYEIMKNINYEEIKDFVSRLVLNCTYIMEGTRE